jgi:hypothetical protein
MRTEQEVLVTDLVDKYQKHLIQRGSALMRKRGQEQASSGQEQTIGTAIFNQLLDGCLLTLAYSDVGGHQLCVLAWRFTNPALN